jgi:hypothetical protein
MYGDDCSTDDSQTQLLFATFPCSSAQLGVHQAAAEVKAAAAQAQDVLRCPVARSTAARLCIRAAAALLTSQRWILRLPRA